MIVAKSSNDYTKIPPVLPGGTARKTKEVFNIENVYVAIGDNLNRFLEGLSFSDSAGERNHRSDLTLLALVTVFQFAEDLADRPACLGLSRRMDWRYALRLPAQYPGLQPESLCAFRQMLIGHPGRLQEFQQLLDRCISAGLLGRDKRGVQAGNVVDFVCRLNQLERMHDGVSQAIGALAGHQPELLRALALPHWYHRYQGGKQKGSESIDADEQQLCAQALGADARHLLQSVEATGDPDAAGLPEIRQLAAILKQQYEFQGAILLWRNLGCRLCPWLAAGSSNFPTV